MLVVGLTGSIGSGKSTVAKLFQEHGTPVIDADVLAREFTEPNTSAYTDIVNHFGPQVVATDGSLNRSKLREIIFDHPKERRWLEDLLHPLILQRMKDQIGQLDATYCIAVIPLLLESEAADFVQRVLVVDLPESIQLERATLRDKSSKELIQAIMKTQLARPARLERADDVIDNSGSPDDLLKQVDKLHQMYLKLGQD